MLYPSSPSRHSQTSRTSCPSAIPVWPIISCHVGAHEQGSKAQEKLGGGRQPEREQSSRANLLMGDSRPEHEDDRQLERRQSSATATSAVAQAIWGINPGAAGTKSPNTIPIPHRLPLFRDGTPRVAWLSLSNLIYTFILIFGNLLSCCPPENIHCTAWQLIFHLVPKVSKAPT
jgi:hypothetical protein